MITMQGKYQTQSGLPVRVLCVDGPGPLPVIGLVNGETISYWESDGTWMREHQNTFQLIPVPTRHEGWILVDCTDASNPKMAGDIHDTVYTSKEHAEQMGVVLRNNDSVYGRGVHQYIPAHVTWED